MIRMFKSKDYVEAVEFTDAEQVTIQEIIRFTGLPVTVNYTADGAVQVGLIKNPSNVLVAKLGQFIYRDSAGNIGVCDYEHLTENYEEVTETAA